MRTVLYPGSFDPVTVGHVDIIARAAAAFDRVVVGVLHNPHKPTSAFSVEDRLSMLRDATAGFANVTIAAYAGLLVDIAHSAGVDGVVRGLRMASDFDVEMQMARLNRQTRGVETVFFAASPEVAHISSKWVRDIGRLNGSLRGLVPEAVRQRIEQHLAGTDIRRGIHG